MENPKKGEVLELVISDPGDRDTCFARWQDKLSVFVHGPLAVGDRVMAEVTKIKKSYLEARFQSLVEASPHRVEARCSHFGTCGGCKWQHVVYEEQLRIKKKLLLDALTRIGGLVDPPVEETLAAENPWGYRNKLEFSFSDRRYLTKEEMEKPPKSLVKSLDFALGFHASGFYQKAIDIDTCHLGTPEMNTVLHAVRAFALERHLPVYSTHTHEGLLKNLVVRQGHATGEVMVNLVTTGFVPDVMEALSQTLQKALGKSLATLVNNVTRKRNTSSFGEEEHVVYGPGVIHDQLGPFRFRISANSFFQTHAAQAHRMFEQAMVWAECRPDDLAFDLYCGTGSLSFYIAQQVKHVVGIEAIPQAIEDAMANAEMNGVENIGFLQMDMKNLKPNHETWQETGTPDLIFLDPPRAGVHAKALAAIKAFKPRRIVHISCNPGTLARDVALLCEDQTYRLVRARPVDMFPHTRHVECMVQLDRV